MKKTRGDLLSTLTQKIVKKIQLYGFLTDTSGAAVLDTSGNEQVSEVQVGSNGRLKVDALISGSSSKSGQKNVVASGTPVALGTSQPLLALTVVAKNTNTGNIYVGDNAMIKSNGFILVPGAGHSWTGSGINVANIWIDADVSNEGVSWTGVAI